MKHFFAVVLFAIIAGLVSCEVAYEGGIKSIPATARKLLGLPEGQAVVAKFEAAAIDAADVKSKVADAVEGAKAKVADVADKSIEAAQPDRSADVAPAPADNPPEAEAAAPASNAPGATSYYGGSADTAVAGWAAEATMNPDYQEAPDTAAGAAPAEPTVETAEAPPAPEPSEQPATEPAAEQAAEPQSEPAPQTTAEAPAAEEPAPVSSGGDGQSSYFGFADKPDSDQPWAAAAAANPDYAPEQQTSAATADAPAEAQPTADAVAADAPAPALSGGNGQTSYFGFANIPDADQPWSAAASMNADYSAEQSAPEPAAAATEQPAAEPAAPVEAPVAVETPAAVEEPAPVSLGGTGVTSLFGVAEKPDATQPWAAAATNNPEYTTAVVTPPATPPATQEAVEACRDALNAEAQTGGLNFGLTRWDIAPENYGSLDKLAKLAKDCGGVVIEVRGHTDNTGRPASNQTLSDLRAKAVVTYLTKAGVPLSKLKAIGFGQDKPIGDNATNEGRRKNRRIEFLVTGS